MTSLRRAVVGALAAIMCTAAVGRSDAIAEVRLRIAEYMTSPGAALLAMAIDDAITQAGGMRPIWHTIDADISDALHEALAWDIVITSSSSFVEKARSVGATRDDLLLCSDPIIVVGPKGRSAGSAADVMRAAAADEHVYLSCLIDDELAAVERSLWAEAGVSCVGELKGCVESSRTDVELLIAAEEEDALVLTTASSFAQYVESSRYDVPLAVLADTEYRKETYICLMSTGGHVTQRSEAADRSMQWLRDGGASRVADSFKLGGARPFSRGSDGTAR